MSSATSFQHTEKTTNETNIKRKKFDEFSDLPTIHIKFNANIQSILEKILEEQLKQRATIKVLEENNTELKREVLENRKLIQNMFTALTVGPLNVEQTQGGKAKQRLKRKDTKHMWWDAPMTKAYHRLFQTNKNPSDAEIEHAFKLQIQVDNPEKMQELSNSNGWSKLWYWNIFVITEVYMFAKLRILFMPSSIYLHSNLPALKKLGVRRNLNQLKKQGVIYGIKWMMIRIHYVLLNIFCRDRLVKKNFKLWII